MAKDIIRQLQNKLIVSCQAFPEEPLYGADIMAKMAVASVEGGAAGIRACWPENIKLIKQSVTVPVVGINKVINGEYNVRDDIIITPSLESALIIAEADADIIALDGTLRKRTYDEFASMVSKLKQMTQKPLMADISTLDEAVMAQELGFDIVSTTLSGYTRYSKQCNGPDLDLIEAIHNKITLPINAEGRFIKPEDIEKAFQLGAWCMTIGSAITRPEFITRHFVEIIEKFEIKQTGLE
ncbi:MAG: N-acetylmannosamine-6-phosphate 2-epimerase [Anaerolineaceae bacterium]|nr:N-acetylmannosamine-6-phosphate 2-epimerase [Anaerolineaceae bacterium]